MRHILLYENFEDDLGVARDLFGLTSTFTKAMPWGDRASYVDAGNVIEFTGPVESEDEARKTAAHLLQMGGNVQAGLDPIGWQAEVIAPIEGTGYVIKGPLANWTPALRLIVKWTKDIQTYVEKETSRNPGEVIPDDLYYESFIELLENEKIQAKCAEIGYRVIAPPIS